MNNPMYCPLCGAHEFEHGEGEATDEQILEWKEEINKLHTKLQELEVKNGQ